MEQILFHIIGDYVTQSDWMAQNKTKSYWAAFCHAFVYSLPFLLISSVSAWWVIFITHFLIDRFRLARFVAYAKNFLGARSTWKPWAECSATGYHDSLPAWMSVWLMIACDNTLHLCINYAALRWL